ncbi:cation diffusion facilitator family transporter [Natronospira bacteriovora]|uniref:Cation diffusion facilitator family transporter n=1 Tax=Natronospira bacteriovora TaxID=3069753 RepID=A0ABU0W6C9_9GAMM|nr:cation diffusion facilitator family transporter [Natronospira sp. AB-CW4]MDQ2069581.1 cation diffusion facilitator family transporter [Natronospira sp. AB-CW4]
MMGHHHHGDSRQSATPFLIGIVITLSFAIVEFTFGWIAGSLALMGDAAHMASDSFALALAGGAAWLAQRPASKIHTFGLGRAEVLAAMINATVLMVIVGALGLAAIQRLLEPRPVEGNIVFIVGSIGLMLNLALALVLMRGERTLNKRGALLHVIGDLLGSVAAISAGLIIVLTGWTPIDPLLTLFICALILVAALRLLRDAGHIVMEGVPRHLDVEEVGQAMATVDGVESVHDLHIWALSSTQTALSAHVLLRDINDWPGVHWALERQLRETFGIEHATLQPERAILGATRIEDLKRNQGNPD